MHLEAELLSALSGRRPKFAVCDRMHGSQRFVSFWDMLKLDPQEILSAVSLLGSALGEYRAHLTTLYASSGQARIHQPIAAKAYVVKALQSIIDFTNAHGMKTSNDVAKRGYKLCFDVLAADVPFDPDRLSRVISQIESILNTFVTEAKTRNFYALDAGAEHYHKGADDLFGARVVDVFPDAQFDIEEAGKCLTFELWTASVMHLMRVHECALRALADHFGVTAGENWNKTLSDIETALRAVRASNNGRHAEQMAAEAGTHLRFVKNAHRNHVMHAHAAYDERRARDIFESTRAFMMHLADVLADGTEAP